MAASTVDHSDIRGSSARARQHGRDASGAASDYSRGYPAGGLSHSVPGGSSFARALRPALVHEYWQLIEFITFSDLPQKR